MDVGNAVGGAVLFKSNRLGPSFGAGAGNGSGPGTTAGVAASESDSGLGPRVGGTGPGPRVGSGIGPRSGGTGPGPRVGSGGDGCCGLDAAEVIAVVLGPGACGGRSGPTMPFQVETQQESYWCWAAVTSAVDRYYSPNSFLAQCEVVSQFLPAASACLNPDKNNVPGVLENALSGMGLGTKWNEDRIDFAILQTEIDAGRPVCVAIDWAGGSGVTHFVVLCGYQEWTDGSNILQTVDVADPFYPDSTRTFADFPTFYHGGGTWSQTYFTI
jgi:hypothetical protein